jgi:hypothetical protein
MCQLHTLAKNSKGSIIHCPECNNVQLNFGNVSMRLNAEQLQYLYQYNNTLLQKNNIQKGTQKRLTIPINQHMMLQCNYQEVNLLDDLLQQSLLLLEVYELLASE